MRIQLDKDESAKYWNYSHIDRDCGTSPSDGVLVKVIGIGFIGWIVTTLITGRIIASLFWPIWIVLILLKARGG